MKKFLSLVLALVMTMSLVTVSAGAKEFTDDDAITYDEAITVISTIGVVDGYEDGSFNPSGLLTRQAAAKIICNLILGPTTAEALRADAAPFPDVPVSNPMSGYIAYCAQQGIINGYPNGNFNPGGNLTGNAFMKMLLGALGYDSAREGFTGDNWSIQVAKLALGIGLDNGLEGEFDGSKTVNREEAALYALNMIQADLVEYETVVSTVVNGQVINVGSSIAKTMTWKSSSTKKDYIKADGAIQFAEEYFTKLERRPTTDDFGRPTHTWVYDKVEQGEYLDTDLMVAEYTKKVTFGDLFDVIGKAALDNCDVVAYVDGETVASVSVTESGKTRTVDINNIVENLIYRGNKDKAGQTGKGVLTQVFIDTDKELITVAVINTYLAKAKNDYDTKKEEARFDVYAINRNGSDGFFFKDTKNEKSIIAVDRDDFAGVEDIEKDQIFLVTVANKQIQTLETPEIVSETTINSFKLEDYVNAEGTQYDYADTAKYDPEVLDQYTSLNNGNINLKDLTYNIILDPYGYLIGIERNEDPDKYLFLTGVDQGNSNLVAKNADANAVFLDGTMSTITIDMDKSKVVNTDGTTSPFSKTNIGAQKNNWSMVNTWCTYTVNTNNVYTVRTVPQATTKDIISKTTKVDTAQYKQNIIAQDAGNYRRNTDDGTNAGTATTKEIGNKRTSLTSWFDTAVSSNNYQRVYGTDETVYLNLELKPVWTKDTTGNATNWIVDDVESVTTGVKNVKFTVTDLTVADDIVDGVKISTSGYGYPDAEIYPLYDDNGELIAAAILNGENDGVSSTWAYITSKEVEWEGYNQAGNNKGGTTGENEWTWKRSALVNGEQVDLIERGDTLDILNDLVQGEWYEIRYDGNGNVRKATSKYAQLIDDSDKGFMNEIGKIEEFINSGNKDEYLVHDWTTVNGLTHEHGTLWTKTDRTARLRLTNSTIVVRVSANDKGTNTRTTDSYKDIEIYTGLDGMDDALDDMNVFYGSNGFKNTTLTGGDVYKLHSALSAETVSNVEISSVVSSNGDSRIIVLTEHDPEVKKGGSNSGNVNETSGDRIVGDNIYLEWTDTATAADAAAKATRLLTRAGYSGINATTVSGSISAAAGNVPAGYVTARDGDDNPVFFDVYGNFFWTIKVNGNTVATVSHNSAYTLTSANYKSDGGTGLMKANTPNPVFVAYTGNDAIAHVTAAVTYTSGWFKAITGTTAQIAYTNGGSQIAGVTGLTSNGTDLYAKVGEKVTVETQNITFDAGEVTATATLKNGSAVLATGSADKPGAGDVKVKVEWTPGKDITADPTLTLELALAEAGIELGEPIVTGTKPTGLTNEAPTLSIPTGGAQKGETYWGSMTINFPANCGAGNVELTVPAVSGTNNNLRIVASSVPNGIDLVKPNQISWKAGWNGNTAQEVTIQYSVKVNEAQATTFAAAVDPEPAKLQVKATFGNTYVAPGGSGSGSGSGGSEGGGGEEPDPTPTTVNCTATPIVTTDGANSKGGVTITDLQVTSGTGVDKTATVNGNLKIAVATANNDRDSGVKVTLTVDGNASIQVGTIPDALKQTDKVTATGGVITIAADTAEVAATEVPFTITMNNADAAVSATVAVVEP